MTKKFKGLIIVLVLFSLGTAARAQLQDLSFADAVRLMNEESLALHIAELNLKIAVLDYNRAIASNLMTNSEYSRLQAELSMAKAENTYQTALDSNFLEIFRKYTDVLAAERDLVIRQNEKIVAEHNYNVVREKVRLGDAGRLDDLREINKLEAAERATESAQTALAERHRALNSILNLGGVQLNLTTQFDLPQFDLDLQECLEMAMKNTFDIWERESGLQLQEMQLQKSRIDGTAPLDLQRAELNLEIARLNHLRGVEDLRERITSSFQSLKQSRVRYQSARREREIAKDSLTISEQQAELGLITEIQLLEAQLSLLRAVSNLEDAIVNHTVSQIQFEQLLGLEVEHP